MYAFVQGQSIDGTERGVKRSIDDSIVHGILVYGWADDEGNPDHAGNPIHRMPIGARVYAYQQEKGYYGVGTVVSPPMPIEDYEEYDQLEGVYAPGYDLYVRVQWERRRPYNPIPYSHIGYAPRNVAKINDAPTLTALEKAFEIE